MKVDFNNLRVQMCNDYDRLVDLLRRRIYHPTTEIRVYVEEVEEILNDLRQEIAAVALCYDGTDDVRDVLQDRVLKTLIEEEV